MKIQTQNIYGGSQQFADNITNHTYNLSENDRKIIELAEAEEITDTNKIELVKSLETVKSSKASDEEKNKSKRFFKTLLEDSLSLATKEAIKAILTQGAEYVHFQDMFT